MLDAGYIYVLINSSMPGLVKVGKTSRDPKGRAAELSAGTAVPTPFVVVYSAYFPDCSRAEEFVHALLQKKGHRVAPNREFFNAPTEHVINAVINAMNTLGNLNSSESLDSTNSEFFSENALGQMDSDTSRFRDDSNELEQMFEGEPWEDLLLEALEYRCGAGDVLRNPRKALKLYEQAAKLGSVDALSALGEMYEAGDGCTPDKERALEYYGEAVSRGEHSSYPAMAHIYSENQEFDNFHKCWKKYFESDYFKNADVGFYGWCYIHGVLCDEQPATNISMLVGYREQILSYANQKLKEAKSDFERRLYERIIGTIKNHLFGGSSQEARRNDLTASTADFQGGIYPKTEVPILSKAAIAIAAIAAVVLLLKHCPL